MEIGRCQRVTSTSGRSLRRRTARTPGGLGWAASGAEADDCRARSRRRTARTPGGLGWAASGAEADDCRARSRRRTARTPGGLGWAASGAEADDCRARSRRRTARTPGGLGWAASGAGGDDCRARSRRRTRGLLEDWVGRQAEPKATIAGRGVAVERRGLLEDWVGRQAEPEATIAGRGVAVERADSWRVGWAPSGAGGDDWPARRRRPAAALPEARPAESRVAGPRRRAASPRKAGLGPPPSQCIKTPSDRGLIAVPVITCAACRGPTSCRRPS